MQPAAAADVWRALHALHVRAASPTEGRGNASLARRALFAMAHTGDESSLNATLALALGAPATAADAEGAPGATAAAPAAAGSAVPLSDAPELVVQLLRSYQRLRTSAAAAAAAASAAQVTGSNSSSSNGGTAQLLLHLVLDALWAPGQGAAAAAVVRGSAAATAAGVGSREWRLVTEVAAAEVSSQEQWLALAGRLVGAAAAAQPAAAGGGVGGAVEGSAAGVVLGHTWSGVVWAQQQGAQVCERLAAIAAAAGSGA